MAKTAEMEKKGISLEWKFGCAEGRPAHNPQQSKLHSAHSFMNSINQIMKSMKLIEKELNGLNGLIWTAPSIKK